VNPRSILLILLLSPVLLHAAPDSFPLAIGTPHSVGDFSLETAPFFLDDQRPISVEGGPGFLVAWEGWYGIYPQRSYATLLDPSGNRLRSVPFLLPFFPPVAAGWSGEEFLIGAGLRQSRFNTNQTPNLTLRRYSATGEPIGDAVSLGFSQCNAPLAESILWSGNLWLVTWRACNSSYVVALDRSLRVTSGPVAVTGQTLRLLEGPDGQPYLLRSGETGMSVSQISPQLTLSGEKSTSERLDVRAVLVADRRLYLAGGDYSSVTTAVFDFDAGWSAVQTRFIPGRGLTFFEGQDSIELLASRPDRLVRLEVNNDATTRVTDELTFEGFLIDSMSAVKTTAGGKLIYSLTRKSELYYLDIYSTSLESLTPNSLLNGELLSTQWVGGQSTPSAVTTSAGFVLLWDQYVPEVDAVRTFTLLVDSNGAKLGAPEVLPAQVSGVHFPEGSVLGPGGQPRSTAWNGTRLLVVWTDPHRTIRGLLLDAFGRPVSSSFVIGEGIDPVASASGDEFLVLWEDPESQRIRGASLTRSGDVSVPGGSTVLENGTPQWDPALTWVGSNFVGAWFQRWNTFHFLVPTVELTPAAAPLGADIAGDLLVAHDGSGRQVDNLQLERLGNFVVATWSDIELQEDPLYLSLLDLQGAALDRVPPIGQRFLPEADWSSFDVASHGDDMLIIAGTDRIAAFRLQPDNELLLLGSASLKSVRAPSISTLGSAAIHVSVESFAAPEGFGTLERVQYRMLTPPTRKRAARRAL